MYDWGKKTVWYFSAEHQPEHFVFLLDDPLLLQHGLLREPN